MNLKCEYCRNRRNDAYVLPKKWATADYKGEKLVFCCERHKKTYVESGGRDWRSR